MAANKLLITLADGEEITVQPTLQDRLEFETVLRKNKRWGGLEDNALKLQPFLGWSAARRTAPGFDLTWDEFTTGETAALSVDVIHPEDDDETPAPGSIEETADQLGKDTTPEASTP